MVQGVDTHVDDAIAGNDERTGIPVRESHIHHLEKRGDIGLTIVESQCVEISRPGISCFLAEGKEPHLIALIQPGDEPVQ